MSTSVAIEDIIVDHEFFEGARKKLQECMDSFGNARKRKCLPIYGPSGSGKSTMIETFLDDYPPIKHETGWERPVVVVETPSYPTPRSFASEVLRLQGDPLYFQGSEVEMTARIVEFAGIQKTRLFIFDELQVLIDRDSARLNFKTAEWIKRLINQLKVVPVVIVGLEQVSQLFLANEQVRRRFRSPYFMPSFDWHVKEKRKILKGFLKAVEENLKLENGLQLSSSEIVFRFYCATNGLVGYIMEIIAEANALASKTHSEEITREHLAKAYVEVVCGNHLVGVNPFTDDEKDIEKALIVVEVSLVSKGGRLKK